MSPRTDPKLIFPQGEGSRLNADLLDGQHWSDIKAYIDAKIYEVVANAVLERGFVDWNNIINKPEEVPPHTHSSEDLIWYVKKLSNGRIVVVFNDGGVVKLADASAFFLNTGIGGAGGDHIGSNRPRFMDADGFGNEDDPRES